MCRHVIAEFVPLEEEDEDFIVEVDYTDGYGYSESFEYDTRTGLELVEGKFPNLRYAIAVLFYTAWFDDDIDKLEVLFRQFILADELHDIIYRIFIALFGRYDGFADDAISWLCYYVEFDIHKEIGFWDDESVITNIMRYGMYDLARQLFRDGVAYINVNSGREPFIHFPLEKKDYDMVRFMVAHDLDLNQVYYGSHPLDCALLYRAPMEIIQLLIDNGADVNWRDEEDNPLLFRVIEAKYYGTDLKKSYIRILLLNGCRDIDEYTDVETLEVVRRDAFDLLPEGLFSREEWEGMKPSSLMKLRSGKVVTKRKRGE
jgi:hypothetical protein